MARRGVQAHRFPPSTIPLRSLARGTCTTWCGTGTCGLLTRATAPAALCGSTQTPLIARFSTVIHERGSPETLRDPRGFAVKFYTR